MPTAIETFEGHERLRDVAILRLRLGLDFMLELSNGWAIVGALCNLASLQRTTIEASTIVIEALTDDLPASDNDGTVAIVKWGLSRLLKTEREIVVGLHFESLVVRNGLVFVRSRVLILVCKRGER